MQPSRRLRLRLRLLQRKRKAKRSSGRRRRLRRHQHQHRHWRRRRTQLRGLPLRRGKWTPEEQNFSEVLIQAFLAGLVPDCADGTTLRAFLSRRLHCAPMRITKKFAGATLGKSIFSRTGQLDAGDAANLRRLESLFVRAEETNSAEAALSRWSRARTSSNEILE